MISLACVDTGGHYTQEVYMACRERLVKRVIAIKGKGGVGIPFTKPPSKVPIKENKNITCWLYMLSVGAGKEIIMSIFKVQQAGAKYCHFSRHEDAGYDALYFNGLLSEKMVPTKSGKPEWKKLIGHAHNEALDCRNYALAAVRILNPDMDALERQLKGLAPEPAKTQAAQPKRVKVSGSREIEEW
jgi:phage terminase large subunit GpA-like protein